MTTGGIAACALGGDAAATAEILTLARRLSKGAPVALVAVASPEGVGRIAVDYGASEIRVIVDDALAAFRAETWLAALSQYCSNYQPRAMVFGQSFESRQLAPLLAGRLGCPIVMNVLDAHVEAESGLRVTASAFGGDTHAEYVVSGRAPVILCLMPNAVTPETATPVKPVEMTEFHPDLSGVIERVRVVSPAQSTGPRLEDAQVIVAGGRGLGKPENFALVEELAETLGGMAAASRPIVDDGWTDSSRQIGLTGKIARPALYIAAGISGASQHMAGCSAAKTIVAINRDPDAPIFRYASFGAVGDCLEILPEMVRALAEEYAGDGVAK